jgi:hypothetical protein
MNLTLYIIWFLVFLSIPFIILIIGLYILSKKFKFTYKITGIFEISQIVFEIENDLFKLQFLIDKFKIRLVWLRIRFLFEGVKSVVEINDSILKYRKKSNFNKTGANDLYLMEEFDEEFEFNKEKFYNILFNKFLSKNVKAKKKLLDKNTVDTIMIDTKFGYLDKIIKKLSTFIDLSINNLDLIFKIKSRKFYYGLYFKKLIIGTIKENNKVNYFK